MIVVQMESNMEYPEIACRFNASHEWVSLKRGNRISTGFLSFSREPGIAKNAPSTFPQADTIP